MSNIHDLKVEAEDIKREIDKRYRETFGRETREADISLIKFNGERGIISCNHKEKMSIVNLINSIDSIKGIKVNFKTIGASGTIKSAVKKYMYSGNYAGRCSED